MVVGFGLMFLLIDFVLYLEIVFLLSRRGGGLGRVVCEVSLGIFVLGGFSVFLGWCFFKGIIFFFVLEIVMILKLVFF